jgi:hypothetical protein
VINPCSTTQDQDEKGSVGASSAKAAYSKMPSATGPLGFDAVPYFNENDLHDRPVQIDEDRGIR